MTGGVEPHKGGSSELVALARSVGGDLVVVLSWPQYAGVSKGLQLAVAEIVRGHDDLNTLVAVDYFLDAARFHDQDLSVWWSELVDQHDLEHIVLALNALRELGWRGKFAWGDKVIEPTEIEDQLAVEDLIEFIEQITALELGIVSVEGLIGFINRCGGWDVAQGLGDEQLLEIWGDPEFGERLRREYLDAAEEAFMRDFEEGS